MGKKVLVVDDDEYVVELISYALKKNNFEVIVARDGMQARALLAKEKPDLLILDVMVPKIDGIQLCEGIKKDTVLRDIPVIMISAAEREEITDKIKELGVQLFLRKPFTTNELISGINAIFS